MTTNDERALFLQETLNTKGWAILDEWLKEREKSLNKAATQDIINLKYEELPKWILYYSGELNLITNFRKFIENELNKPFKKEPKKKNLI